MIELRTREDCLLYAQALLEQVIEQLDTSTSVCDCCSLPVYQNRDEYEAAEILSAMAMKLNRMSGQAWAASPLKPEAER